MGAQGSLAGKTAIVTGASRGIGLAVAHRLVAEGAKVTITARKPEALEQAAASLGTDVAMAVAGKADDPAHREDAVRRTIERFGSLDLLVNNTGINTLYGPLLEAEEGAARKTFEVNVLAMLAWTRLAHDQWMGEHGGAIVNVASAAGLRAAGPISFYGGTKAMVCYLTGALAVELAPRVRINAVAPAVVKTRFATVLLEDEAGTAAKYPLKRLGVPEDIAGAVAFLLGDDAAWITGQTLAIDGGLLLEGGI